MSDNKLHQVETDPILKMKDWWQKNQKVLVTAIVVVVIAVGGWYAYKTYVAGPKEDQANLAIYHAETYFRADSLKLALNGDGLHKGFVYIAKNFDGTKAGNLAKYYAGVCYLQTGDFKSAVKYLEDFSTNAKQIQMMAYGALGDAYSELKQNDQAVSSYKKAAETFGSDELNASEYLFRAGLLSETIGKTKEAVDIYKELKEKFPTTAKGRQADKYIYRLSIEPNETSSK